MVATIDLKAFLDWYKTATIELGDKKRVFREPVLKDLDMQVIELLEKYCIEWDFNELQTIIETKMPFTKRKELYDNILQELGLVL